MIMESGELRPSNTEEEVDLEREELPRPRPAKVLFGNEIDEPEPLLETPENAEEILERVETPRDPEAKVDIARDKQEVGSDLKQVKKLIEEKKAMSEARGNLGMTDGGGETLKRLEEAKEKLEEEGRYLGVVEKYENVFETFSELSESERAEVAKTGTDKFGESFYDKYGEPIDSDIAKALAHSFIVGGGHITWGGLMKLGKVVDKLLEDAANIVKGIFKSSGGGEERAHAE